MKIKNIIIMVSVFFLTGCQEEIQFFQSTMLNLLKVVILTSFLFLSFFIYIVFIQKNKKGWDKWRDLVGFGIPILILSLPFALKFLFYAFGLDQNFLPAVLKPSYFHLIAAISIPILFLVSSKIKDQRRQNEK